MTNDIYQLIVIVLLILSNMLVRAQIDGTWQYIVCEIVGL